MQSKTNVFKMLVDFKNRLINLAYKCYSILAVYTLTMIYIFKAIEDFVFIYNKHSSLVRWYERTNFVLVIIFLIFTQKFWYYT